MTFPALKAVQDELAKIFEEAGPTLNLKSVTSVPADLIGRPELIQRHIVALNDRATQLGKQHDQMKSGRAGTESGDGTRGDHPASNLKGAQILTKGQSLAGWVKDNHRADEPSYGDEPLSFGKWLKGVATNRWENATAERKALSEGTLTAGGHMVPTPVAGSVIDLARNAMRVMQAGATVVPMTSNTLKIPRLTSEGTPGWRNENAAITGADMVFDSVTFTARSLVRMVLLSRELFEDQQGDEATNIIEQSFAAQIALELDRVALRGSGTPPEPRGVLNTSGITTTAHGANGSVIGSPPAAGTMGWEFLVQAAGAVRALNFEPSAQIMAPRTDQSLGLLRDTTNQYIAPPRYLDGIPRLTTKQVPITLTVGSSSDCSEVYTGQWNLLGVGIRTSFDIQMLRERFIDNLQYAFLATMRADIQLAQPAAFVVDTGVRG